MADETTGSAPVESLSEESVVGALENQFSATPKQQPKEAPQPVEESDVPEQPDGEPTEADLESEEAPQQDAASEDTFEIVHNGQQVKLTRAEIIANAQKGFDYDRKTQAVAETQRQYQAAMQRLAEIEQVQPHLTQFHGKAASLAMQLQSERYSDAEMLKLADSDPFEAHKRSIERDILRNQFQQAHGMYEQAKQAVSQQREQLTAWQLQQEHARLPEVIPAWKDEAKMQQDKADIAKYLQGMGVDLQGVGRYLDNAIAMKVVRDAMNYQRLSKLKAEKSKQLRTAPPVVKPGTAQPDKGRADRDALSAIRKAGKSGNHSAQEKLMEGLLGKTFKL